MSTEYLDLPTHYGAMPFHCDECGVVVQRKDIIRGQERDDLGPGFLWKDADHLGANHPCGHVAGATACAE